MDLSLITG